MKKFLVAPDSFKGTLSSKQICEIITERINAHYNGCEVISIPVADGGEGSIDCFLSNVKGEVVKCKTVNPYFEEMEGFYGLINNGNTAIVEMAVCAGLPLVENRKNPMLTTTYGVGLFIKDAVLNGAKEIILCLGGSSTNDFGCGAAAALGVNFYDENGNAFIPVGESLSKIAKIEKSQNANILNGVKITIMCDVKNPVYGLNGAAYVYAPQKGATKEQVKVLDDGLKSVCEVVKKCLNVDVTSLEGGGAAGAMAGGMYAFFNADMRMGIDVVLDTINFDSLLDGAFVVFTGEGKIDSQSLQGKVVAGVTKRASKKAVPVIAIVGGAEGDISNFYNEGINSVFTINRMPEDFSISRHKSEENLRQTVDNVLRLLKI